MAGAAMGGAIQAPMIRNGVLMDNPNTTPTFGTPDSTSGLIAQGGVTPRPTDTDAGGPLVPMPQLPTIGGGKGGGTAAPASPTQGQFAPLAPAGGFNVNQAAAGALQQAMQGTQAAMGFQAHHNGSRLYPNYAAGAGSAAGLRLHPSAAAVAGYADWSLAMIQRSAVALHWLVVIFRNTKAPISRQSLIAH